MRDWLPDNRVVLGLPTGSWEEQISLLLDRIPLGESKSDILRQLVEREKQGSTMIGNGVSVPHCRWPELTAPEVVAGTVSDNNADPRLFFLLLSPDSGAHLRSLAKIASLCQDQARVDQACNATTAKGFRQALSGVKR